VDKTAIRKAELVGLKLMKASEGIQDRATALFRDNGLSAPQYNVLRILRGAGPEGLRCQEISKRMITRVPDITRLLDRLEDKDLVLRERSTEDRRVVISVLTLAGRDLLKTMDRPLDKQVKRNFARLSPDDLARLETVLDLLLEGTKI
jgi:DNA-binding MarR family transcriptional regulator